MPNDSTMATLGALLGGEQPSESNMDLFGSPAVSAQDARTAALLQALQAVSEPQRGGSGFLGGLGAIARAAGPILGAPAAGRQIQRESELDSLKQKLGVLALMARLKGTSPKVPTTAEGSAVAAFENDPEFQKLPAAARVAQMMEVSKGFKPSPVPGSMEERAGMTPIDALKYRENLARSNMLANSDEIAQRSQAVAEQADIRARGREEQKLDSDYQKKLHAGNYVALDPATFRKNPRATRQDDESGSVITLSKTDGQIATQLENATRDIYTLKDKVSKLLPERRANMLVDFTATMKNRGALALKRQSGDPDVRVFDEKRKLGKYPLIQAVNKNTTRFPLAEMHDIEKVGTVGDSDTQASANALLDDTLSKFRYVAQVLGLDMTQMEDNIKAEIGGGSKLPPAVTDRLGTSSIPKKPVKFERVQ